MKSSSEKVETLNREIDRILQGGSPHLSGLSEQDQRALGLANHLTHTNLSEYSTIRRSLRRHLTHQATRVSVRHKGWKQVFPLSNGRAFAGACLAMLLVVIWVFGLFNPGAEVVTPVYATAATSANSNGTLVIPRTMTVNHNPDIFPKPVPTPVAVSAKFQRPSLLSESTPKHTDHNLGIQGPIVTTTISK